jgi:hypothetical protein
MRRKDGGTKSRKKLHFRFDVQNTKSSPLFTKASNTQVSKDPVKLSGYQVIGKKKLEMNSRMSILMEAIPRRPDSHFLISALPLLVPHFAFPPSAIIRRKPLSPTSRRAGWVCPRPDSC